ncbi:SO_0444 family Cu/Zn efflux transporter [Marinobacterium aestuariivivens]|uniref:SO_0444 family Cu/Zn efflux transporter n=1 Tax=Marinobacterium aestuariivivens TaxID=1698799 RepID=A0ABW2A1M9_9GAMM
MLWQFLDNLLDLYLDTAFWLLAGLLLAGLIKGWIPQALVRRWLDGRGAGTVVRASLIGAPLPLCSCGVLPAAIGLRRAGASKPSTVSFLIATPETGVDSVAVSYALLGPVLALVRPLAAILSAIASGLLVLGFDSRHEPLPAPVAKAAPSSCCSSAGGCDTAAVARPSSGNRARAFVHDVADLVDDIAAWLAFGLVLAALVSTLVEPSALLEVGDSVWALLLMLLVGLPLYICATASTPLAAAMLAAGLSPGAVLVFMLAGPATNIAALGILVRELGRRTVALYLAGICGSALLLGYATNWLLDGSDLYLPIRQAGHQEASLFGALQWLSATVLLLLAIRPLRRRLLPAETGAGCCDS